GKQHLLLLLLLLFTFSIPLFTGVIKCKKDRDSGDAGNCAACASPKPLNNSQILQLENYRLVIKNTSIADSGLYHCFVRTDTNVDIVTYRLTVRMRLLSPSDLNGKKISVENGDTLSLPCLVTSPHPIETRWFLPNNQIFKASDMKGRVYVSQNNTLIIKKVTYEDAGEYSCLAANLYGADMLSHLIVVTGEKEDAQRGVTVSMGDLLLFENEDSEGEPRNDKNTENSD
uniref:Ig-like domain-containing protein n=1 Tax=Cyprinus carpio TaxID=7962 RepID=A0A8C1LWS2_CYPCA